MKTHVLILTIAVCLAGVSRVSGQSAVVVIDPTKPTVETKSSLAG